MRNQFTTLTSEECDKLLDQLLSPQSPGHTPRVHHRNYTMTLLMLDAGCRVGEVVKLEQDQLIFNNSPVNSLTIFKHQAKNKHERTIPTSARLRDALRKMQAW
ncbi:unnamed protein product, partial [marine sediment metagenome]